MILIQADDFDRFLAAFGWLRNASVEVTSAGGNELLVPDDTDRALLRSIADTGAVVHADLGVPGTAEETEPEVDTGPEPGADSDSEAEPESDPEVEPKAEAEPPSEAKPEPAADKPAPKKSTRARRKTTTEE